MRGHLIRPDQANVFTHVDVAAIDGNANLLLDGGGDVGCRHRAIQAPLRTCFGLDDDRLRLQALLEVSRGVLLVCRVPRGHRLNVGDLLQGAGRRHDGQTAWNQEVARVPVSHIFDLTGCGDVGDVFLEEYLHALVIE